MKFPYLETLVSVEKICEMTKRFEYDIAAILSFDLQETSKEICGYPVISLEELNDFQWDIMILVCDEEISDDIIPKMVELQIGREEQFKNIFWLLKQFMIQKYAEVQDPDIQATLEYWKTNKLSVFNQHIDTDGGIGHSVFFDDPCGLPNVYFETFDGTLRKMFFPRDFEFTEINGEKFVINLTREQEPTSPHLYIKGEHKINPGDIIIDAGVCEGNFALKYVDICSKMYLFECEPRWVEVLEQTFRDYRDKVTIIPKFLSDVTDDKNITLDDALPDFRGQNIFIKMDIEGAEPKALRGAKRILTNNRVKASVCAYHNADDCIRIKGIFRKYGYEVSTSNGWMVFAYDPKIFDTADFRKGIVYAENY
ncbi:MAG: FkbM family methyltransferase [Selenomonadaceae bacterium]|nr:FkbM family methyltransferase [Selenomonadaceae bacterium]